MKNGTSVFTSSFFLRAIFFVVMLSLAILQLAFIFRGLDTREGMEQATLAREVARGNGLTSKIIYPAAVKDNQKATSNTGTLTDVEKNTYHAPLQPLIMGAIFKAVGAVDAERWRMRPNEQIYALDRVVATFSVICYLLSIGIVYLLVSRMFDGAIAGATALLMLLCELMWSFSMSGLPQMLMLFFFSAGLFFAFRTCEAKEDGQSPLIDSILASLFFTLLALTHWLAIWIAVGYAISAAIILRPRGICGLVQILMLALAAALPVLQNLRITGTPGGTAFLALYEGLSFSEDYALRSLSEIPLNLQGLVFQVLKLTIQQNKELFTYFGAILAAPFFFLALLHPFKRVSIASFRWILLIMWFLGALGMGLFGLRDGENDSNQLHILFAPIFAAYGLAIISILWARLNFTGDLSILKSAHLILIVLISGSPLLLTLPKEVMDVLSRNKLQAPHFPPYAPSLLNNEIADFVQKDEILATDQPWAVAWYADRRALWLPVGLDELEELEELADAERTPIVGVLLTPVSGRTMPLVDDGTVYGSYFSLVIDGWAGTAFGAPAQGIISNLDPRLKRFKNRYPLENNLTFRRYPIILYTARRFGA